MDETTHRREVAARTANERRIAVAAALAEDIGSGDVSSLLVAENTRATGRVISREPAVIAGRAWVDEVFAQVDPRIAIDWLVSDGDRVAPDQALFRFEGPARALLTGERAALNFLQTLSGTATRAAAYLALVEGTGVTLLDTRKTLPGLRSAQKYAITCGGCANHRHGLFDAFLIKENHLAACGGVTAAVAAARALAPSLPVEVEVESLAQLDEAVAAGADTVMLDNFSVEDMREAVTRARGRAALEVSGNVDHESIRGYAETGVDYISIGDLTKSVVAVDLSMRFDGA